VQATAADAEEELDEFEPIEKLDQLGVNRGTRLRIITSTPDAEE